MADKPFRVLLDLTDLHLENFKYVWINVSPRELKFISDFKTAIRQKINLERDDFELFVRDGLLLEQETIIVLREDDTVKVQYKEPSQSLSAHKPEEGNKKCSRKRNSSEYVSSNKKRCKLNSGILEKSEESSYLYTSCENKKKCKNLSNSESLDKVTSYAEDLESNHTFKCKKKKDKIKSTPSEINVTESKDDLFFSFDAADTIAKQQESTFSEKQNITFDYSKESSSKINCSSQQERDEMDTSASNIIVKHNEEVNVPKKKRKRHKKRKQTESTITESSHIIGARSISFSENEEVKGTHIIYSPVSCEKESSIICDDNTKGVEESPKDMCVINKNMSAVNFESFKNYPKISTPSQSKGCSNPNWQVSLMQSRNSEYNNEVHFPKKDVKQNNSVLNDVSLRNLEEENIPSQIPYEDLPPINCMPEIGTYIAYKTLELDESYSPVISEYREGIVQSINPDTSEVNIELLKHLIKPGRTGKFENLKKDEFPSPEIKKYELLRWHDVISPKQL